MLFQSTYELNLDAKNRLTVPSKHRAQFASGAVLAADLDPCLGLWPAEKYDEYVTSVLAGRDPISKEYRKLSRYLTSNAHQVELDSAGRVMVPPFLMDRPGIAKEVALVGRGDRFELWDRKRWKELNDSVAEDLEALIEGLE